MKVKILLGDWEILPEDDKNILGYCTFPERIIRYNLDSMGNYSSFKHCLMHEITHAFQAETGNWQNVLHNGKRKDEFDSEWIAEFCALYAEEIVNVYNKVKKLYKE